MKTLKELVKEPEVSFVRYVKGELWYSTTSGFEFPVPVDDCGDGVFLAKDKTMLYMRYIRKHLASIEAGKAESTTQE